MDGDFSLTGNLEAAPAAQDVPGQAPAANAGVTFLPPENPEHIPPFSPDVFTSDRSAYWNREDPMVPVVPDEAHLAHVENLFRDPVALDSRWNALPFAYLMTPDDKASIGNRQFVALQMGVGAPGLADIHETLRDYYALQNFGGKELTETEFYGRVQDGYATRDARHAAMTDAAGDAIGGLLNGTDPSDPDEVAQWVGRHEGVLQDATLGTAWGVNAAVRQAVRPWLQSNHGAVTALVNQYGPEQGRQLAAKSFMQNIRGTPDGAALLGGNPAVANAGVTFAKPGAHGVTFLPDNNPEHIPPPQPGMAAPRKPRFGYVQLSPWQKFDPTGIWSYLGTREYWQGVVDVFNGYYDVTVGTVLSTGEAVASAPRNAADLWSVVSDQSQLGADSWAPALKGAATETGKGIATGVRDFGEKLAEGDNRAGGQLVGSILTLPAVGGAAVKLATALKAGVKLSTAEELALEGLSKDKSAVPLSEGGLKEVPHKLEKDSSGKEKKLNESIGSSSLSSLEAKFPFDPKAPNISTPVMKLRSAKLKEAHHIIQDAAVRDLPGYDPKLAPGIQLKGPSHAKSMPHYHATRAQRVVGRGTYGAERKIAFNALKAAGWTDEQAIRAIQETDIYFKSIGVTPETVTRIPGRRK